MPDFLLELRSEEIPARSRDARSVIPVTKRQSYILRVRNLAKASGEAFLMTDGERRAPARHIRGAASIARLTRIE
ncbi:MAG: hypothetical protein WDZ83_04520 [Rhizobiaceae bacterium]